MVNILNFARMNLSEIYATTWIGLAGTVFGVLGIILSIVFYLKSRRLAKPCYAMSSTRWFDSNDVPHEDLQLQFRGRTISRFTITHIAFWNAGSGTIRPEDFAPSNLLRIAIANEVEVFDIRMIGTTTPDIQASLDSTEPLPKRKKNDVLIRFEYLDHDDGFVIQLIHDSNSHKGFHVKGKIPGIPTFTGGHFSIIAGYPFDRHMRRRTPFPYNSRLVSYVFIPITCLALGAIGILSVYWSIFREFHWYQILGAFFLIYLIFPFAILSDVSPPRALCDAAEQKVKEGE